MEYKRIVRCDYCSRDIVMPMARLEWGQDVGGIKIAHPDCSIGARNAGALISDIELQYNNPNDVISRIWDLVDENKISYDEAVDIIKATFNIEGNIVRQI